MEGAGMKKAAIIMPALLPMPPVKGGAVETLVDGILKENEKSTGVVFHVFGIYDESASAAAKEYQNTQFKMVSVSQTLKRAEHFVFRVFKKLFGIEIGEDREYIHRVLSVVKQGSYDAVVVENDAYFTYRAANALKGVQIFSHIHNDIINSNDIYAKRILKRGVQVITVSRYIKERVMTVKTASDSAVSVLLNCTDLSAFGREKYEPFRNEFRQKHNVGPEGKLFVFAGRVIPEKGVLELARAFVKVKNKNTYLLIVGSGWFSQNVSDPYLEQVQATLKDVSDRIIFTGYVPFEQMPKFYAAADVAVLPSIWEEPASLTVLESLATGLPLITTDAGGVAETANENCAFILKRDEKLVDNLACCMDVLSANSEVCIKMERNAKQNVKDRNFHEYYKKFITMIFTKP